MRKNLGLQIREPLSPGVLCGHAEISNCLKIKVGVNANDGPTLSGKQAHLRLNRP